MEVRRGEGRGKVVVAFFPGVGCGVVREKIRNKHKNLIKVGVGNFVVVYIILCWWCWCGGEVREMWQWCAGDRAVEGVKITGR